MPPSRALKDETEYQLSLCPGAGVWLNHTVFKPLVKVTQLRHRGIHQAFKSRKLNFAVPVTDLEEWVLDHLENRLCQHRTGHDLGQKLAYCWVELLLQTIPTYLLAVPVEAFNESILFLAGEALIQ